MSLACDHVDLMYSPNQPVIMGMDLINRGQVLDMTVQRKTHFLIGNLASYQVDPHAVRVKIFLMVVDPGILGIRMNTMS